MATKLNSVNDWEDKVGVPNLDALQQQRRELIEKVAPLEAMFGARGTYDDRRKVELSRVKARIRAKALPAKIPQGVVDDMAHVDDAYVDFVIEATKQRAKWVKLSNQIRDIDDQIFHSNTIIGYARSELKL